jgi:hypothetical protein
VEVIQAKLAQCRAVDGKIVSDDRLRLYRLVLQQELEELQSRSRVTSPHLPFIIHGSPQVYALASDFHHHLVEVPTR